MTWKVLRQKMAEYRKELESKLHRKAKLYGMYVSVWGQGGFTLEAWMRAPNGKFLKTQILGDGDTIGRLFASARQSLTDGTLSKYLKKPKTPGSRSKKRHK